MTKLLLGLLLSLSSLSYASVEEIKNCEYSVSIKSTQINGSWDFDGTSNIHALVFVDDPNVEYRQNMLAHRFDVDIKSGMMKRINNDSEIKEPMYIDENGDFTVFVELMEQNIWMVWYERLLREEKTFNFEDLKIIDENTREFRVVNKNGGVNLLLHSNCRNED